MAIRLSHNTISSFCGNVLPLRLLSEESLAKEPISWRVEGNAVAIRTFSGDSSLQFNDGVLLILNQLGTAVVEAEYEGLSYTCTVTVRERRTYSNAEATKDYIGDMHNHTSRIHNPDLFAERTEEFPEDYVNYVKEENIMDVGVISDHAGTINDRDFFRGFIAEEEAQPMEWVVFPGSEAEIMYVETDRFGVSRRHSGEIVTFNAAGYGEVPTWEDYMKDITADSPLPVAIFAHPHVVGYSTKGVWNFQFEKRNYPEMLRVIRGVELGNGGDRGENLLHEYAYSNALDNGFRVSVTCSSDAHHAPWGYHAMPGKTIVQAPEKSREAFLDAFLQNRFYACESGDVKLRYTVNGQLAPCDLASADSYTFHVELSYFHEDPTTAPVKCQVISNRGVTLRTLHDMGSSFDFTVDAPDAAYFYLRLMDAEGRKTWSYPVWTGKPLQKTVVPDVCPLDMSAFTATDVVSATDASKAINGDPFTPWIGGADTASIVIDMQQAHNICAFGYMPQLLIRDKTIPDWTSSMESPGLPTQYQISVSLDGVTYEICAKGVFRVFGDEEIISFPEVAARFVRFDVLSNVGNDSGYAKYAGKPVRIGNLTIFTKA